MASFQAKLGWKRLRKREIKVIISFCSCPTHKRKVQKNSKQFQKIKKHYHGIFSSQNRLKKAKKERK